MIGSCEKITLVVIKIPLVTGTFDTWDTFGSVGGAIKGIDRSNKRLEWIYGFVSGERSLGDLIIQEVILSVDFAANKKHLTTIWFRYLKLRDEISAVYESSYSDLILKSGKTLEQTFRAFQTQG